MTSIYRKLKITALGAALLLSAHPFGAAQTVKRTARNGTKTAAPVSRIDERRVRATMNFLASDALSGRGSATQFERLAAQYIAAQLEGLGVEPAGETGAGGEKTFIQTVDIARNAFADNPRLTYAANGSTVTLEHAGEMLVARMNAARVAGALQKMTLGEKPSSGAVAFVKPRAGDEPQNILRAVQAVLDGGASAVIVEETPALRAQWSNIAARKISFTNITGGAARAAKPSNIIIVSKSAAAALALVPDGTPVEINGRLAEPQTLRTWNAVGKITGGDARLAPQVVLLSAHLDHLGTRDDAPGADKIFNGADDDASGCVAVLELARVLAGGARPKRTVYFSFFGSEEAGGYGAQFFVDNLPFPKDDLIANLEFEMIGRPDPKVAADELWLTGFERSNLGAELAKRGAKLVADPHPEENFFQRSDNYTLARQGVIAHTVSSFGLHADYHRASDEIKTIDFDHMTRAVNSMVAPVDWLVNSAFKPVWLEGKKP